MDLLKKSKKELIKICEDNKIPEDTGYMSKTKTKSDIIHIINRTVPISKSLKPLVKWSGGKTDEKILSRRL